MDVKRTEAHLKRLIQEMPKPRRELHFANEGDRDVNLLGMVPRKQKHLKYTVIASCMLLLAVSVPAVAKMPFIAERMQAMPNWMEEYVSEEMKTDEGTDFMKPIDETQNYESARKVLDMMCGDEWTDASAWYYCQSIPGGYLVNDKYAYIFVDDRGKDLWFSYRYGEAYPCRIHNSSFELFTDNLERVEEHGLYEHFGVEIEDHLIELDIETGKVISNE